MSDHRSPRPPTHEPVKVEVVANADRVRLTDKRLLIIFVLLMVLLGGAGTFIKHQFDAVVGNCQANRSNTLAFNDFITTLQRVTLGSQQLTGPQKHQRVVFYQDAKSPVPQCPKLWWGTVSSGKTDPPSPLPTKPLRTLG